MKKAFLINAHHLWQGVSEGKLNNSMFNLIKEELKGKGYEVQLTEIDQGYEVEQELEKHQWADCIIVQMPVNWMGPPWTFKKYMDEVYSAGMMGRLCNMDGRHRTEPKKVYAVIDIQCTKRSVQ